VTVGSNGWFLSLLFSGSIDFLAEPIYLAGGLAVGGTLAY